MNPDKLPSKGTQGVVVRDGLVPLGTLKAWGRWQGYYRKECTDSHLLTLLTFPWLLCNFTSSDIVSKEQWLLEYIPLTHRTIAQESPPLCENFLLPVALNALTNDYNNRIRRIPAGEWRGRWGERKYRTGVIRLNINNQNSRHFRRSRYHNWKFLSSRT